MATPDEVRASLLRGESRDGTARRKVADQVRQTIEKAGFKTMAASDIGDDRRAGDTLAVTATAASAVVLASGLRAPETTQCAATLRAEVNETLINALPDVVRRLKPGESVTVKRNADGDRSPITITFKSPTD